MCRLAAYLGPRAPLSALLYEPRHSLEQQACRPRHQRSGLVNVDGTGIAWWEPGDPRPLRYVTDRPPWSDANLPSLAPRVLAGAQLAAVRSATPGIPHGVASVAPFTDGPLACVHNGWIGAFREATGRPLIDALPDDLWATVDSLSDSHVLFLSVVAALREDPAGGLEGAVIAALHRTAAVCRKHDAAATLTLAVGDGERVVAATAAVGAPANGLFTLAGGQSWPTATLVASEPLDDDGGWHAVAPGLLVHATRDDVRTRRLDDLEGTT